MDVMELVPDISTSPGVFLPRGNRYDSQRICLGEQVCRSLASLQLFMIGCGAIGCEMLKNYATMGVATAEPVRLR